MRVIFRWKFLFLISLLFAQCKHEPIIPEGFDPNNPTDTTVIPPPPDTSGTPCEPGVIYFENDVLPILTSSCGVPGCHDAITAEEDIVLVNYSSTMASDKIKPGRPLDSDLYKKIIDNDPDDKMPPPNSGITLTTEQINTIRDWIAQGAQNLYCDPFAGGCDTLSVSFSTAIQPIINAHCKGCHNASSPQGNVILADYNNIKNVVNDGRLMKSVTHSPGVVPMPYLQAKLSDCKIALIRNWIDDGAPNN